MINILYFFTFANSLSNKEEILNGEQNNIKKMFKDLKLQFENKETRKKKFQRIITYLQEDIKYLKFICLQNALQSFQNQDKRKKVINSIQLLDSFDKQNLTITPVFDMTLRVQIINPNKPPHFEEIESEKLLKEINSAVNYIIAAHKCIDVNKLNNKEKIFFNFEKKIIDKIERKKILDDLDKKLYMNEKKLIIEAEKIIDKLFQNEELQQQLIATLEKNQDIAPYEELELFFMVRCQLLLTLKK